ncbi:ATP-binding protein [Streptomyces platensis subsp. malvinus]
MELHAVPARIGHVRRIVSSQLRRWHLDALIDPVTLGVTELLANVHRHASPSKRCTVELSLLLSRLTVSVYDDDPRLPRIRTAGNWETCGRGLALIAALSESWGMRPEGGGKVVWFTLPALTAAPAEARTARSRWDPLPRDDTPARTPAEAAPGRGVRGARVG